MEKNRCCRLRRVHSLSVMAACALVCGADGDNALIESGKYTPPSLMMTRHTKPGDVVFDIDDTFACGWGSKNTYGLDVDTKSFTKCGAGTLLLTTALNGSVVNAGGDTRFGNALTCGAARGVRGVRRALLPHGAPPPPFRAGLQGVDDARR